MGAGAVAYRDRSKSTANPAPRSGGVRAHGAKGGAVEVRSPRWARIAPASALAVDRALELSSCLPRQAGKLRLNICFKKMEAPDQRPRWRPAVRAFAALAGLGRHEEALAAVEEAVRVKDGFITELLDHRLFVPLHDEPRFMRIVKELEQERRVERLKLRLRAI